MPIEGSNFNLLADEDEMVANVTLMSFITSLVINLVVFTVILIGFAVLYIIGPKDVFNAKWINNRPGPEGDREISAQTAVNAWLSYDPTVDARSVIEPPRNVFKLLKSVLTTPDGQVLRTAGLDAYMHLKILKLALTYFSIISGIFGFVVLVPVTLTADSDSIHITPGGPPISGLDKISISAVPSRSPILWIYCIAVYIFTFALFVLIVHLHTRYLPLRYAWLAVPQASRFSVLALDLPLHIQNDAELYRFIDQLFPGQVHSVCLCTPAESLARLVEKREELVSRLERMAVKLETLQRKGKTTGIEATPSNSNMSAPLVSSDRASVSSVPAPKDPLAGDMASDTASSTAPMDAETEMEEVLGAETTKLLKSRKIAGCIPLPDDENDEELLIKKILAVEEALERIDKFVFNYRTYGTKYGPSDPVRERKGFSLLSTLSGVTSIVTSSFGGKSRNHRETGGSGHSHANKSPNPASGQSTPSASPTTSNLKQVKNPLARTSDTPLPPGTGLSASSLSSVVSSTPSQGQNMTAEEQRWLEAKARCSNSGVYTPSASAFITFNNLASATIAAQSMLTMRHKDIREFVVVRAPEPRDVLWENVGITQQERLFRKRIAFMIVIGIVLLYLPITTFISSLTTVQSLSSIFPGIEEYFQDNELALAFVEGYLPALLLAIFLALMPVVFRMLSRYGGARSRSEKTFELTRNLFIFRIWIQFIFFVLAGTLVSAIDTLIHEPLSIATMLATAVPRLAGFFAQFYLLGALTTVPLGLLRIWPVIQWFLCRTRVKSRREIRELRDTCAGEFDFGVHLSNALVAIVIGLTFSAVAPLISVVMVLWMFTSYCVHKHDFLHISRTTYQTGGSFWKLASNLLCVGMIIFHLTMIGIIGLKESPAAVALIPLPIITILFWMWMDKKFTKPAEILPLEAARNPEILLQKAGLRRKRSASLEGPSRFPVTQLSSSLPDSVAFAVDPIERSLTPFGTPVTNLESKASHFPIPSQFSPPDATPPRGHRAHTGSTPSATPSETPITDRSERTKRVLNPLATASASAAAADVSAPGTNHIDDGAASSWGPPRSLPRSLSTGSGLSPRHSDTVQRQHLQDQYEPFVYKESESAGGGRIARALQPTPTHFSRSLALEAALSLEAASQPSDNQSSPAWDMNAIAASPSSNTAPNPLNVTHQVPRVALREDEYTGVALEHAQQDDEDTKRTDVMICYNSTRSVYLRPIFRSSFDTQWTRESVHIADLTSNV